MPQEELPIVSLLLQRQRCHPLLEGFPAAARIGDLPLFLGAADAAQDAAFLKANDIQAVIALGTGNLIAKQCDVLLIDILDMEDELFLPHFDKCIHFLKKHLVRKTSVLVHCVYGQSRSAAVCVAYLMATQGKTLLEAYDVVQQARQCISINPGFLRQLELFERMGNDPEVMGSTSAHAELRTMMLPHLAPGEATSREFCAGIFIEPMLWMMTMSSFISNNNGKLLCPSCKAKLGSWNWLGVKCNCKRFVTPAFLLVSSRTQERAL
ncbi:unnamed protein product [Peronospora destructor]|uniref:protein-tyrosine-phosphatase n=1 Tax=Peronospora destructor TaxID=86335 RepID=A0AAV0T1G9_9STRA|nr:unnamed protein product [Peronospora destructor]